MHLRAQPLALFVLSLFFLAKLNAGALTWEKDKIVTEIMKGDQTEVKAAFPFKNTSDHPVTITSVETSCGCTTAGLDKKTYAAGEGGVIAVVFNAADRTGLEQKYITVTTDEPQQPPIRLLLQVTINEYYSLEPHLLIWKITDNPVEQMAVLSALTPQSITSVVANADGAGGFATRIEVVEKGRKYNVYIKPLSMKEPLRGVVTFQIKFTSVADRTGKVYLFVNPAHVSQTDD
jgi:hypothetical protein